MSLLKKSITEMKGVLAAEIILGGLFGFILGMSLDIFGYWNWRWDQSYWPWYGSILIFVIILSIFIKYMSLKTNQ